MTPTALSRRQLLAAGTVTAGASALTAVAPALAAARIRTVTKQVAVRYKYDPRTQVTTVTKFRVKRVTVKFVGRKVFEKRRGQWVRSPYMWNDKKNALVYSRRLHLKLRAVARRKADPGNPQPPAPSPSPTQPPPPSPPVDPPADQAVTVANIYTLASAHHHVLNRVGYGTSPEGLRDVEQAGGALAWLKKQLDPDAIDDGVCEDYLRRLPDQSEAIWEVNDDIRSGRRSGWRQLHWVNTGMIVRAAWSRRQLLTALEEFWGNHFNVTVPSDDIRESRAHYQWTIRRHALGNFEDLLFAASTHPAMLSYLNNRESDDEHPNENQGRELLELHTVGLAAGYTEDDVLNSARILTGLSVDDESGEFEYKPWRHWVGSVRVLDFSHANGTRAGGLDVFRQYAHHLAAHPATARRICEKLARWFVSDAPAQEYVDRLADVYKQTGGNTKRILEQIFASPEFWGNAGGKTRRPFDAYVAAIRRLGITPEAEGVSGWEDITWLMDDMGQAPFGAPYPTGWPDAPQAWASPASTLKRWNNMLGVADGWPDEVNRPDLKEFVFGQGALPSTFGEAVDAVGRSLFGMAPNSAHKQALLQFLGKSAASPASASASIFGWRLPYVVALLLDSPYLLSK